MLAVPALNDLLEDVLVFSDRNYEQDHVTAALHSVVVEELPILFHTDSTNHEYRRSARYNFLLSTADCQVLGHDLQRAPHAVVVFCRCVAQFMSGPVLLNINGIHLDFDSFAHGRLNASTKRKSGT